MPFARRQRNAATPSGLLVTTSVPVAVSTCAAGVEKALERPVTGAEHDHGGYRASTSFLGTAGRSGARREGERVAIVFRRADRGKILSETTGA
jgi:hypothetical protein